jgi:hypothetical protein
VLELELELLELLPEPEPVELEPVELEPVAEVLDFPEPVLPVLELPVLPVDELPVDELANEVPPVTVVLPAETVWPPDKSRLTTVPLTGETRTASARFC